jgi:peptide-methionine (S)-S-oxide reductase
MLLRVLIVVLASLSVIWAVMTVQATAGSSTLKIASTIRPGSGRLTTQPATDPANSGGSVSTKRAMFAAGCFWGTEATFRAVEGVTGTAVGYCGGSTDNPTYEDVCSDQTGHAETVMIEYDPSIVSYDKLLDIFWKNHDPTTLNRQGPDVGTQYRSVIFFFDDDQRKAAEASKQKLAASGKYARPITTSIEPAKTFWPAEEYHQQYFEKHPDAAACHVPTGN